MYSEEYSVKTYNILGMNYTGTDSDENDNYIMCSYIFRWNIDEFNIAPSTAYYSRPFRVPFTGAGIMGAFRRHNHTTSVWGGNFSRGQSGFKVLIDGGGPNGTTHSSGDDND